MGANHALMGAGRWTWQSAHQVDRDESEIPRRRARDHVRIESPLLQRNASRDVVPTAREACDARQVARQGETRHVAVVDRGSWRVESRLEPGMGPT